jgi:hypothetical protein
MWTVDVENHFITIQRRDCYQERLLDLTETNSHSESRGQRRFRARKILSGILGRR